MNLLLAAFLLPAVFWNKGPETADLLRKAGISEISVPPNLADAWRQAAGMKVEVEDPAKLVSIPAPSLAFRRRVATATVAPWVNSNGWRLLRQPDGRFLYNAPGAAAALAAAEAFMFGARACIQTDNAGLEPLAKMLEFLRSVPLESLDPKVNIGFVDDGSPASAEFMNLLVRKNLLFRVEQAADAKLDLNVALGQPDYPRSEAGNPLLLEEKVRGNLTDEKRLLRIYGSDVVIGRLYSNGDSVRLFLTNYAAARSAVDGLRVRLLGRYTKQRFQQFGETDPKLLDVSVSETATEFTLPDLRTLAIINLAP